MAAGHTTTEITVRPQNGDVVRQEFGAVETHQQHETAAMAVAAREQASIQARYIVAERRPRNEDQFRSDLLRACKRPTFAAKAEYAKPIGKEKDPATGEWIEKKARGASIRFIETALQLYGNVFPEVVTVYESAQARICRVSVTDLEHNITYTTEVVIQKAVERKGKKNRRGDWEPPEGRTVISERINSYGEPTYLVVATEDEVLVKQNALLSKALRTNAQRLLPYDIVEEAIRTAKATLADEHAKDPDAAKRRMLDAFSELGVQPVDIEAYLGHSLNKPLQPAEREELLAVFNGIKEGEITWQQVMESRTQTGSEELQDEVRARKIAEAEAARQAPPASASGSGDHAADHGTPGESGSAPTTPAQHADAAKKLTFGRRGQ